MDTNEKTKSNADILNDIKKRSENLKKKHAATTEKINKLNEDVSTALDEMNKDKNPD